MTVIDQPEHHRWIRRAWVALLLLAAVLRVLDVWRPVDGSVRDSWREPDVAGIARNFYLEDMNLFYPRIDWRGDGPGYVEAEFPLQAWLGACLYHVFGYHEEILRVMSWLLSLAATVLFFRMAGRELPPFAALVAGGIWTISPIGIRMASAIQPEPLMFCCYLAAVVHFRAWCQFGLWRNWTIALLLTILAILAKIPAAHVGLLFAVLCFRSMGWSCLKRRDVWIFAVLALGVPLLWYWHARTLWLEYGNSLGISNEAYNRIASGSFLSTIRETSLGLLHLETELVWMATGWVVGAAGMLTALRQHRSRWIAAWFGTLLVYYLVTGRTTSEEWAWHYHIVSLPVACLLMGLGAEPLWQQVRQWPARWRTRRIRLAPALRSLAVCGSLAALLVTTALSSIRHVAWDLHPTTFQPLYQAARLMSPHIPEGGLIVASGAAQNDRYGIARAYNAPYFFFWTRSRGFTLSNESQSISQLEEYRRRGARFFIAEPRCLSAAPGFEARLRSRYRVLAEHERALLIDLNSNHG